MISEKNKILIKLEEERARLENEQIKLEKQIQLVNEFEAIKPITFSEWQDLIDTPIRYSELLIDVVKNIFPDAQEIKRDIHYINVKLNDLIFSLPLYKSTSIKIYMNWYKKDKGLPSPDTRYDKMRKYFELLDSGSYTWYDLAKCRYRGETSKFKLFIWWYTKGKYRSVDRGKWEKLFKELDEDYDMRKKQYYENKKLIKENLTKLKETLPLINSFAPVSAFVNHCWICYEEIIELCDSVD